MSTDERSKLQPLVDALMAQAEATERINAEERESFLADVMVRATQKEEHAAVTASAMLASHLAGGDLPQFACDYLAGFFYGLSQNEEEAESFFAPKSANKIVGATLKGKKAIAEDMLYYLSLDGVVVYSEVTTEKSASHLTAPNHGITPKNAKQIYHRYLARQNEMVGRKLLMKDMRPFLLSLEAGDMKPLLYLLSLFGIKNSKDLDKHLEKKT